MLSKEFNFTKGFLVGALCLVLFFLLIDRVLVAVGEIDLPRVVEKQQLNSSILFSSGINQNVFRYKLALIEKVKPQVIAIGSSRAMQVREQFFKPRFINLGGTVSNIQDLEQLAVEIVKSHNEYKAIFLFIDPWWFNPKYPLASFPHSDIEYPAMVNLDLALKAGGSLSRGNWPIKSLKSDNLGIHSILTGEGFSADGSYHYTSRVTSTLPALDKGFLNTLNRIETGSQRFEKSHRADKLLVSHACEAIKLLDKATEKLIIIAPPFAGRVWDAMTEGGYEYIQESYALLQTCLHQSIVDFSNPTSLEGATDCEFVDGFHGGDTIAGRILLAAVKKTDGLADYVDVDFIKRFLARFSGHSAGMTEIMFSGRKETDFLEIGCPKR